MRIQANDSAQELKNQIETIKNLLEKGQVALYEAKQMLSNLNNMEEKDKLYTVQEASEVLGITQGTLWRWIRTGKINAVQVGTRAYRIRNSEIKAFIAKCE